MLYSKNTRLVVINQREDGGYLVMNEGMPEDQWIIPKDVFESTYVKAEQNFGWAVQQLKAGYKVGRQGWNGKGMFLYYVPAASYAPLTDIAKEAFNGEDVPYGAYIAMKTAQSNVVPWLASQTDVLADDWIVIE